MNKKIVFIICWLMVWLAAQSLHAFKIGQTDKGYPIKWDTNQVTYYINTAGFPSGSLTAIQNAMQTWNSVPNASFTFVYGGATGSTDYGKNDNQNIIDYGYIESDSTIAVNHYWYYTSNGQLFDSDIRFNSQKVFSLSGSAGTYDLQSIATHEFGHSLNLADLYDAIDSEKTMYGYSDKGETKKRTLDDDDKNGVAYLYPGTSVPQSRLPVYRFYNTQTQTHFFTMDESEKNTVLQNYAWFNYEGIAWYAYPADSAPEGCRPIYRFFNTSAGTHFFTIDANEKDIIISNYGWFRYEGISYYAYDPLSTYPSDALPVYRFFNTSTNAHFFTINEQEKDVIIASYPWFRYENTAWYAFTSDQEPGAPSVPAPSPTPEPTPTPTTGQLTWIIKDMIDDGYYIQFKFYSYDGSLVWPSASSYYQTAGYNKDTEVVLNCTPGDYICYGAKCGSWYWGVGLYDDYGCDSCCHECNGGTVRKTLTE